MGSSLLLWSRTLHSRSNGTTQKGMKLLRSSTIESTDYHLCPFLLAGSQALHFETKPRPKLPTCLVKMGLLANHPIPKLLMPCPKQRADAERQHCMRKILSVSLVSNLSGALTCATMLWELIRISQELLFLIGCSTGSEIKQLVHCEKNVARGFWCLTVRYVEKLGSGKIDSI